MHGLRRLAWGTARDLHLADKSLSEVVRIIGRRILTGLKSMHGAGMCHLDVKPQNVANMKRSDPATACLIDYGTWLPRGARVSVCEAGAGCAIS